MEIPIYMFIGTATSSHQIEGGLKNSWSEWEAKRVKKLSTGLKGPADNYLSNSRYSCDSFTNWQKDIGAIKQMGLNAYRFSIEWSRIFPEKGKIDHESIKYYKNLIKELRANNIEPIVTLWHWTIPIWLDREGGITSKEFLKQWQIFVNLIVREMSGLVDYYITVNEPEVFSSQSLLLGRWPPNKRSLLKFFKFYVRIFPEMHKFAYKSIRKHNPTAKISFAKNNAYFEPYNNLPWNRLSAKVASWYSNWLQLDLVRDYLDFIGLNFYFHNKIGILGIRNDNDRVTEMGWWFKPESIYEAIMQLHKRYDMPIMVTENGLATNDSDERKDWLRKTFKALERSKKDGADIIGYLHWSLLDNFEWTEGFEPKFGLVSVDPISKKRTVKECGEYYGRLASKFDL